MAQISIPITSYRRYRAAFTDTRTAQDEFSLRILALNWRCLRHPQAGGSEINLFEQARRWAAAGHQVTVVSADPGRDYAPSATELIDGVDVKRMGGRFTVYLFAALFLLLYGRNYDYILDVSNGIPFFSPLFTRTPITLLIHHVHGHQWHTEFPHFVAVIGSLLERRIVPLIYRKRRVITVSPTTEEALIELGFRPLQLHVIFNGVEPAYDMEDVAPGTHRIAYVGRVKRYKRLDLLIKVVDNLRAEFPNVHLDLAGSGDAVDEIKDLVAALNLHDHVTLHGYVSDYEKARILSHASVFVTPSMHEGWGISVIEANVYGCPAVAYDVPGLAAAIPNNETGLLAQDDGDFQEAIARVMRDPALRQRLSHGAKYWASLFDWDAAANSTLSVMCA